METTIIFDLDDTLYLEHNFVKSGFRAADRWLQQKIGVVGLEAVCVSLFEAGQRTRIFDDAIVHLNVNSGGEVLTQLIDVYRFHLPDITLEPDALSYFNSHIGSQKYGLLSDGHERTQRAKAGALGIEKFMDIMIFTGQWGHEFWKPHPRGYQAMENHFQQKGDNLVYVADNPVKDFVTAKRLGWKTVRIERPGRVNKHLASDSNREANAVITSLADLDGVLNEI